ncbi:MAG TPA: uracil-DNA glycosylase [Vicinamibacterales bacterium]|nr:uracil-DNA glycosylase [Vicinamibacterales bacterium]HPW20761.1 uracil-DNA glycosylase [Vicinamibacterales bacterium]
MTDERDLAELAWHLRLFGQFGAAGISGDPAWRRRAGDVHASAPALSGAAPTAVHPPATRETLDEIRADLGNCTRCKLHRLGRRQIVFGTGNPAAELMFVGEAPGHDEDLQGVPFVGRAGQLLTKIIESIGCSREDVYIANVIKCRPPENRNPEPDEVASCEPFMLRQVESIRPKVIVALGTFAAQALLRTSDPISRLRGRLLHYGAARLIPTFHPAYLLRSPERKREVWEDMKNVRAILRGDTRA